MHTLFADVRLALRTLAENRSFALVAVLTIALGVGANAAVFSVVNATLIQPLPYAAPERLVALFETARRPAVERRAVSYPNFRDWRRETGSFEAMSVVLGTRFTMGIGQTPERIFGELVFLRLVLSGGITFIAAGLALGSLAGLSLTRLLASLIYGVSATDPARFAAVAALLAVVGVLACLIPAVKAARLDPLVALRVE